jgi:hypothetical protein
MRRGRSVGAVNQNNVTAEKQELRMGFPNEGVGATRGEGGEEAAAEEVALCRGYSGGWGLVCSPVRSERDGGGGRGCGGRRMSCHAC